MYICFRRLIALLVAVQKTLTKEFEFLNIAAFICNMINKKDLISKRLGPNRSQIFVASIIFFCSPFTIDSPSSI